MTNTVCAQPKLSAVQANVTRWLSQSWHARVSHGTAVEINGKRICNTATLLVLERHGLVYKQPCGLWSATSAGKQMNAQFGESVVD